MMLKSSSSLVSLASPASSIVPPSVFRLVPLLLSSLLFVSLTNAVPLEDMIENLPLYGQPPTTQFSGYLDATDGCDTKVNGKYCKLHYWLAMAEDDPEFKKPIILWLNGGPGSSSVIGFLQELGPLLTNATGGLQYNPYSWTKVGHVLALEAPIGVGYSYCEKQKVEGKACVNTDKYTASSSRAAIADFFDHKFPELRNNDFFITGESYAGVYIPTLTKEILDYNREAKKDNHKSNINLKGISVGDPCTDNVAQENSMDSLWYGHKNGLVDEQTYDLLWNQCKMRAANLMSLYGGKHYVAAKLNSMVMEKKRQLLKTMLSNNLRRGGKEEEEEASIQKELREYANELLQQHKMNSMFANNSENDSNTTTVAGSTMATPECLLAYRKFLLSSSRGLSQGWKDLYIDDYSLFAPVTNKEMDYMTDYMNREDVKLALHVTETPTKSWPNDPDIGFNYKKEYSACNDEEDDRDPRSMIDFYQKIVPNLGITYVYNGDSDPCVSYEGTRTAVKRVGFNELDGGSYRPWFYNETPATIEFLASKSILFGPNLVAGEHNQLGAQFGGEIVNYEHNLSFLTFHGSGHMVPQFRPQAALHMVAKLVQYDNLLTPLLPKNETLQKSTITEHDFNEIMDHWTESAMSQQYVSNEQHDHNDNHSVQLQ